MMIGSTEMTMSRRIRNGFVSFLTVATSVLMFGGVIAPHQADASVGIVTRWPATPQIVTTSSSASARVYPGTDTNRLLLVAVACEYTAAGGSAPTMNVTFGGQTATQLAFNTTGVSTIWLGYLNEAQIAAATSHFLTATQSFTGRTLTAMYATAAVFNGVNQALPTAQSTYTAGATTMTISGLATTGVTGNTGLAVFVANWNGSSSTPSAGYIEMTDYAGAQFNLATSIKEYITSSESFTSTASSTSGAMAGLVLNPATNVSTIGSCGGCHGNPPFDGLGRNKIQGTFSGSHSKHAGFAYGEAALVCSKCHYNHTTTNHQSGYKNITGSMLPGNAYSAGKKIAVTNASGSGNCSNVYCHSNARSNAVTRKYVPSASTKWGGSATTCISCHGGRTSGTGSYTASAAGFKLSTTHSQHIGKYPDNINCQMCHSMTNITDAWTLRPYSSQARHVNGVVDVTFTDITYGGYTSYKSTTSGSGGTTKTCGNVSCHGGTTRAGWSETLVNTNNTCVHCHGTPTYTGAGNTTANRKYFAPGWAGTGTSTDGRSNSDDIRVGAHFSHLSSAHMAKLKCTECHTVPDTPFTGTHMALPRYNSQTLTFAQASSATRNGIAFPSFTSGTATKAATCSTVYCHGAKMRNGDTSGSYRKPSWNMELTTSAPDATTCGRCHGMPPAAGTTASVHAPYTLISDCTTCHTTVVDATGKIRNKTLHMDGKLQAPGAPCNSCHSAKSNDTYFAANSAHKLHIYTSMKWADYQDATETNLQLRSSPAAVADTYKFKCGVCHNSDATRPTYATHMGGNVSPNQSTQIFFGYYTTAGKTTGYTNTDVYYGTDTKGTGKTWTAGNGTSCATTYCHSNGQSGASFIGGSNVLWSTTARTATPARCTLCHGGARGSINPMNSGKHNRHMNNWTTMGASLFTCKSCHAGTVSDNTTILPSSLRHVNKQKNYSGLYAGDNYNTVNKTCTTFYCHSDSKGRYVDPGTWTAGPGPKMCDGCHGRSASDPTQSNSNGIGYPNYTSTGKGTFRANSHPKHVAQLGITDTRGCAKCHSSTADRNFANRQHPLSSNHLDGNTNADLKPDRTAGISFSYQTATKTCNNASCHKSGKIYVQQFANVQWGDTGTCRMCHGNRNSAYGGYSASRSGFNLSTTHMQHLKKYPAANINCQTCHYKTAADAASFKQYTGAIYHNNNKRNVYLAPTYGSYSAFKSFSSSNAPIPATNTKNCSNTSCHGGVTRNSWQKTTYNNDNTCVHCHGVAGTSNTLPNTKANRKFFAPGWQGTGISTDGISSTMNIRVGSHFKHLSSAYMKTRNCNECHTVPDTPFTGTHMAVPRYNSQTLNFDQASSAKWSGVTLANVTYPFNGYTAGTAIKAATCSSIYCHGNRLKNNDPGGVNTFRKPYWNYSAMVTYSNPTVACGRCHGNPPASVTASHNGKAATTSCSGCHGDVVDATGKIKNKALHINGVINVAASGDCLGCHNAVNGPRRIISTELGSGSAYKSHHVLGIATSNLHCIVCHAEGDSATLNTSALHSNGSVDLRNVDAPGSYWTLPATMTPAAYANLDTFCFRCHDAGGAAGIAMSSATTLTTAPSGAQAQNPFADTRTNSYDQVARSVVLNVEVQFTSTNPSHHAVLGRRYSSTGTQYLFAAAKFNTFNTLEGTQVKDGSLLHCADCHALNGHGTSGNEYMLKTTGDATGATLNTTTTYVCMNCHLSTYADNAAHTGGNGQDFTSPTGLTGSARVGSKMGSITAISCMNCHGGKSAWGGIHGMSGTYSDGATVTQTSYRFMPGMANSGYTPAGWVTAGRSTNCYTPANTTWSGCTSHTGGTGAAPTGPARPLSY